MPEPIDGGAPAPAEPDRAQLTLSASACAKLRAYAAAVTRRHGSKELAALLLGPADEPRRCTDVFLLRHQIVSAASFDCTARNVQRTISEALESTGLELLGLAHLHPPYAFLCHSSTDDEWISEKLAPHLAALPRFERRWSRALPPTHDGAGSVLPLDDAGLLRVRCPGVELAAAVVEGVQTHDRVFSVVFQVDRERIRLYALELTFTYDPVPGEGGEVRLLSSVTADEPEVVWSRASPSRRPRRGRRGGSAVRVTHWGAAGARGGGRARLRVVPPRGSARAAARASPRASAPRGGDHPPAAGAGPR